MAVSVSEGLPSSKMAASLGWLMKLHVSEKCLQIGCAAHVSKYRTTLGILARMDASIRPVNMFPRAVATKTSAMVIRSPTNQV